MFQSSSSPKAGCYRRQKLIKGMVAGFNPHPARRLDAMVITPKAGWVNYCFNPHPARRLDAISSSKSSTLYKSVSILIQPEGWMLYYLINYPLFYLLFQSSSSPKAGCYPCRGRSTPPHQMFQSSSSPKAGCYASCTIPLTKSFLFQSSSSPKAGCYGTDCKANRLLQSFNPHPARRLDAMIAILMPFMAALCFNPHPARRLDAMLLSAESKHFFNVFQSSSSPKAGCYDGQ